MLSSATIAILATALAPSSVLAQNLYWDGTDTTSGNGAPIGGDGVWNTSTNNWATSNGGGTNQAWVADTRAVFSTTWGAVAGIVEIDGDINIDDMYIGSGYELADSDGNGRLIVSDSVFYSQFDGAGTSEISAEIAGTGGVQVSTTSASVAITLSGNNSFTGKLNVSSKGTVNVTGTIATETINILNNGQFLASAGALASGANIALQDGDAVFTNNGNNTISSIYGWGTFNLVAGTLTTDGDEDNQGIGGDISGGGSLTKQGAGILTLSGNNNAFTGGITVAGGTLSLQNSSAAGTGTITTTGSIIDYGGGIDLTNLIDIDSPDTQLQVLAGLSAKQSGTISETNGPRALEKIGDGILVLSAANTYTGETIVTAGTLSLDGGSAIADTGAVTVNAGATLNILNEGGGIETIGSLSGAGTVNIFTSDNGTALKIGGNNADSVFSGSLVGQGNEDFGFGGIQKIGTGNLGLSGNNELKRINVLADGGTLTLTGENIAAGEKLYVTISNNGTLIANNADGNAIADNSSVEMSYGTFEIKTDETIGGLIANENGNIILNDNTLTVDSDSSQNTTFKGSISGTGSFIKQGDGELEFADDADSTFAYTGSTIVNGGTLQIKSALASTNIDVNNDAELSIGWGGKLSSSASINLSGTSTLKNNVNTIIVDSIEASAGTTIYLANNFTTGNAGNQTIAGTLLDSRDKDGISTLTKKGIGILTLSGDNSYTGGTIVSGGTLSLQNSNAAGTGTITTTGSIIDYGDGIDLANLINIDSDTTKLQVLTGSAEQSGIISETGGVRFLEKIGAGELILSAANTYTGLTTISAGTLSLNNGAAIADVEAVTVGASGTLNLMTSETIGAMNNAGIINLQNSAIGNNLTMAGNYENTGTLKIDVNNLGASDTLAVTGTVTLGGVLDVFSMGAEADYPLGDSFTYTIIANDATDAVSGTFASI